MTEYSFSYQLLTFICLAIVLGIPAGMIWHSLARSMQRQEENIPAMIWLIIWLVCAVVSIFLWSHYIANPANNNYHRQTLGEMENPFKK